MLIEIVRLGHLCFVHRSTSFCLYHLLNGGDCTTDLWAWKPIRFEQGEWQNHEMSFPFRVGPVYQVVGCMITGHSLWSCRREIEI